VVTAVLGQGDSQVIEGEPNTEFKTS
jgi:hypothetical protein